MHRYRPADSIGVQESKWGIYIYHIYFCISGVPRGVSHFFVFEFQKPSSMAHGFHLSWLWKLSPRAMLATLGPTYGFLLYIACYKQTGWWLIVGLLFIWFIGLAGGFFKAQSVGMFLWAP